MKRLLPLMACAAMVTATILPPAYRHAHAEGHLPHTHQDAAHHPHAPHGHVHPEAQSRHVEPRAQRMEPATTPHLHLVLFGLELTLPDAHDPCETGDEASDEPVNLVRLVDEDAFARDVPHRPAWCVPAQVTPEERADAPSVAGVSRHPSTSHPLCDTARRARSGVLVI